MKYEIDEKSVSMTEHVDNAQIRLGGIQTTREYREIGRTKADERNNRALRNLCRMQQLKIVLNGRFALL